MFERYSFVAVTTSDLYAARHFWVDQLGFTVTEERDGEFFIVDAGGLRLCVDLPDGDVHRAGGADPVIAFKVAALEPVLAELRARGIDPVRGPVESARGAWAGLRDPDGRTVIVSEGD